MAVADVSRWASRSVTRGSVAILVYSQYCLHFLGESSRRRSLLEHRLGGG